MKNEYQEYLIKITGKKFNNISRQEVFKKLIQDKKGMYDFIDIHKNFECIEKGTYISIADLRDGTSIEDIEEIIKESFDLNFCNTKNFKYYLNKIRDKYSDDNLKDAQQDIFEDSFVDILRNESEYGKCILAIDTI